MVGAKTPHTTMRDPPLVTSCRDSATPGVAALQACLRLHCPKPMGNKQKRKPSRSPATRAHVRKGTRKARTPVPQEPKPTPALTRSSPGSRTEDDRQRPAH